MYDPLRSDKSRVNGDAGTHITELGALAVLPLPVLLLEENLAAPAGTALLIFGPLFLGLAEAIGRGLGGFPMVNGWGVDTLPFLRFQTQGKRLLLYLAYNLIALWPCCCG